MQDWVKELQINLAEEIILVVVGNKADLEKFRKVSKTAAEDYARNIGALGYVEASAKTGDGIEEIFINIAHKLNERRLAAPDGDVTRSPSGGRRLVDDAEGETGRRCCT